MAANFSCPVKWTCYPFQIVSRNFHKLDYYMAPEIARKFLQGRSDNATNSESIGRTNACRFQSYLVSSLPDVLATVITYCSFMVLWKLMKSTLLLRCSVTIKRSIIRRIRLNLFTSSRQKIGLLRQCWLWNLTIKFHTYLCNSANCRGI